MGRQRETRACFDEATKTITHLVWDGGTRQGAVIDPVLDFDFASGEVDTRLGDQLLQVAEREVVRVASTLETHAHAEHLSAAPYIRARTGAKIGIGEHIRNVQKILRPVIDATDLKPDGSGFDKLFADGELIPLGGLEIEVFYTPGHTPVDVSCRKTSIVSCVAYATKSRIVAMAGDGGNDSPLAGGGYRYRYGHGH